MRGTYAGTVSLSQALRPVYLLADMALSRQSHLKVRTGCRTCKTRRTKCDETKPSCLRCTKAKFVCEGYSISLFPADVARLQSRQTQDACMVDTIHQRDIRPTDSLCFYLTLQSLADIPDQDHVAYDFCRRNTMQNLATYHLKRFWTLDADCHIRFSPGTSNPPCFVGPLGSSQDLH